MSTPTKIAITANGTAAPVVTVTIAGADTVDLIAGQFYYDLQVLLTGATSPTTVVLGYLEVQDDVTRALT